MIQSKDSRIDKLKKTLILVRNRYSPSCIASQVESGQITAAVNGSHRHAKPVVVSE